MSEETKIEDMNIYQRIHAIESHIDFMKQDTKGYNYKYLSLSAILHTVKPLLRKYRVVLNMQNVESRSEIIGKDLLVHNEYLFTWVNIDKPDDLYSVIWFQTGKNGFEQSSGSAATYCKRYFLLEQFHIPNEKEDPDYIRNEKSQKAKEAKEKEGEQSREEWIDETLSMCKTVAHIDGFLAKIESRRKSWPKVLVANIDKRVADMMININSAVLLDEVEGFLSSNPSHKAISDFKDAITVRTANEETRKKILTRFTSHENMANDG